ncbi:hypothetical protein D3C73_879660 [compost metagenome]
MGDLVQRVQQSPGDGRRGAGIQRRCFGGLEARRRNAFPGVALLAIDGAGVRHQPVTGLVAARFHAADAAGARAQQCHQRRRAGLVPGAQRDVAPQGQFDVVIHHATAFARGRIAVGGGAAPFQVCDAEQTFAIGGGQGGVDVGT